MSLDLPEAWLTIQRLLNSFFPGGWQPTLDSGRFQRVNACLSRAMTAHGGGGQPLLVEDFTRIPTRAQNMCISALWDGYVVLNEKPGVDGAGEVVRAAAR